MPSPSTIKYGGRYQFWGWGECHIWEAPSHPRQWGFLNDLCTGRSSLQWTGVGQGGGYRLGAPLPLGSCTEAHVKPSQHCRPPSSLSTKPDAHKDKIVVEVKSDKLPEEAELLQDANGEKRSAGDQVGQVVWAGCSHQQR